VSANFVLCFFVYFFFSFIFSLLKSLGLKSLCLKLETDIMSFSVFHL
jgi:hypothetical protein